MSSFSIIVPVYNVGKYLPKCLDSLVNQTYTNIEIICVNDGSTDNSLKVLKEYAQQDSRIKVITQQNQGVSVARNVGIENATGEYILFVDADDWIETNTCEQLQDALNKEDVELLYFNYIAVSKRITKKKNITSVCNKSSSFPPFSSSIWASCFKTSFLKKNNICFISGIKNAEDVLFMLNVHSYHPTYNCIDKYLYNYVCDREYSATKNKNLVENDITLYEQLQELTFYSRFTKLEKLHILDIFSKNIYGCWLSIKSIDDIIAKSKLLNKFLNNYKYFSEYKYKHLIGYNRIKYKYIIRFLKYFRDFFFIVYKDIIRQLGKHLIVLPYRQISYKLRGGK